MKATVSRSKIQGHVIATSSKSYTIRGLMCAALAKGNSTIIRPLLADDTIAAREVLLKVGVNIESGESNWIVNGGNFRNPDGELFCGDSAATLRFMSAICSVIPGTCFLTAGKSLAKRPVKTLIDALHQLGVRCSCYGDLPPVEVTGGTLVGGLARLPGNISSQFVSALLLAAPLAGKKTVIELTTTLESAPYILMTLECLTKFGIKVDASPDLVRYEIEPQSYTPAVYEIEGDWSSASYFLAAGAVAGEASVDRLYSSSLQADLKMLEFLRQMGAVVEVVGGSLVRVKKGYLKAIKADLNDCIDLLPTMMVLAAAAEGTSEFSGIKRARIKESDRVAAMRQGLERAGVAVTEEEDTISVAGTRIKGTVIDSMSDHRIAMAFGILGLLADGIIIEGAECVGKTYPGFWNDLKNIGGNVEIK